MSSAGGACEDEAWAGSPARRCVFFCWAVCGVWRPAAAAVAWGLGVSERASWLRKRSSEDLKILARARVSVTEASISPLSSSVTSSSRLSTDANWRAIESNCRVIESNCRVIESDCRDIWSIMASIRAASSAFVGPGEVIVSSLSSESSEAEDSAAGFLAGGSEAGRSATVAPVGDRDGCFPFALVSGGAIPRLSGLQSFLSVSELRSIARLVGGFERGES